MKRPAAHIKDGKRLAPTAGSRCISPDQGVIILFWVQFVPLVVTGLFDLASYLRVLGGFFYARVVFFLTCLFPGRG